MLERELKQRWNSSAKTVDIAPSPLRTPTPSYPHLNHPVSRSLENAIARYEQERLQFVQSLTQLMNRESNIDIIMSDVNTIGHLKLLLNDNSAAVRSAAIAAFTR
jgi:hypothetical protein